MKTLLSFGLGLTLAASLAAQGSNPSQRPSNMVSSPSAQTMGKDSIPLIAKDVTVMDCPALGVDKSANPDGPGSIMGTSDMRATQHSSQVAFTAEDNTGTRFYRFNVDPKEEIEFSIQCADGDYVTQKYSLMQGKDLVPGTVSTAQVQRWLRVSPRVRAKQLVFSNLENRMLPLMLIVYGENGHPYKLNIKRTQK